MGKAGESYKKNKENKKTAFKKSASKMGQGSSKTGQSSSLRKKLLVQKPIRSTLAKLGASFGFASPLDASGDIFIPGRLLKGAMPGDVIDVVLLKNPRVAGSREGEVVQIVEPKNNLVGTLKVTNGLAYFLPSNAPEAVFRVKKGASMAEPGDKVAAEISKRGTRHSEHQVNIVLRFGSSESAKECAKSIVYAADIPVEFSAEVLAEAVRFKGAKLAAADTAGREDLRDDCIFTIDSATTKDIDDAISAKVVPNGYELGVHIADVSNYVQLYSMLDKEAFARGNSVYYADQVIPMLPKELSNGICSLNPDEDRLAFSCLMKLDKNANVVSYRFSKTLIRSKIKGVYQEINSLFEKTQTEEISEKYKDTRQSIDTMLEIYQKLAILRKLRGNIDIESDEPYLVLDDEGVCIGISKRKRGDAEKLIEESMLLANGCAAALAKRKDLPFVYRVHEKPPEEKVESLKEILTSAGVQFRFEGDVPTQQELSVILDKTRGTGVERFVHTGVLRSMAKARYDTVPAGHFGLALEDYSHFTSPIRRYSDLVIHRVLSDYASGLGEAGIKKRHKKLVEKAAVKTSECEIKAQKIERDCDDSYKAEYMRQFIGEEFDGVISSVTSFGIYVELGNTVEGLVHISNLSKSELVLAKNISLSSPLTGEIFKIGQQIKVRLLAVDVERGNIDFAPAQSS